MNKPNPLVPQGTLPDKGKAQIRITVFAILAVHVVMLGVLLIAGCNRKTQDQADSGIPPVPPPVGDTNWPAQPSAVTQEVARLAPTPVVPVQDTIAPTLPPSEPVATGVSEHTIAKGESFYTLGKKYGVGYKAIADANPGVNPNRLKIGDKIKIPPPKMAGAATLNGTVAPTLVDGGVKTYKVKSGDNLGKIGTMFGVTPKQLRAANNLKTDQIKVGQTLKIPMKETAAVDSIPPVPAAPPAVTPAAVPQ
jgi:LysM repeat protein